MPKSLSSRELKNRYDEFLNECYGTVKIAGLEYSTSFACKEVDPTAYRCGFNDWIDAECQDERLFEVAGEYYDELPDEEEANA